MKRKGICAKCSSHGDMTKHHILPKVFYLGKGGVVYLCRTCHNNIEVVYLMAESLGRDKTERRKLMPCVYRKLLKKFLP